MKNYDSKALTMDAALDFVKADIVKVSQDGELTVNCPRKVSNRGGKAVPKTFGVNLPKQQFKCFRECSDCIGKGGPANLVRVYNPNWGFNEACNALGEYMEGKQVVLPKLQKMQFQAPKKSKKADVDRLDAVYRSFLKKLKLNERHREDFRRRGLTDSQINEFGIRSIPTVGAKSLAMSLKQEAELKGVPLFGKKDGEWIANLTPHKTGVFVPYTDLQGRIQQLQIRYDIDENAADPEEEKKNRYRWATSSILEDGASATNVPFWGRVLQMPKTDFVIVTEGGIKATVASYLSNAPVVAVPGVTCYSAFEEIVSWAKEQGKYIVEAFDMDGKKLPTEKKVSIDVNNPPANISEEILDELRNNSNRFLLRDSDGSVRLVNESVRRGIKKMYDIAKEANVQMIPWIWDPHYKGIDDFLFFLKLKEEDPVIPKIAVKNQPAKFESFLPNFDQLKKGGK